MVERRGSRRVTITKNTLSRGIEEFDDHARKAIEIVLEYYATMATSQMKQNARWTDRTSAARNGLIAKAGKTTINFYHAVPYGIWLEVRWSGKYAIVGPTRDAIAPAVLRTVGAAIMQGSRPR